MLGSVPSTHARIVSALRTIESFTLVKCLGNILKLAVLKLNPIFFFLFISLTRFRLRDFAYAISLIFKN